MKQPHPDPSPFIFSIVNFVSFKKLNGTKRNGLTMMEKISNSSHLHFIFIFFIFFYFFYFFLFFFIFFYFFLFFLFFFIFYNIEINIFHKNKNYKCL